jgi:hypothetical protein
MYKACSLLRIDYPPFSPSSHPFPNNHSVYEILFLPLLARLRSSFSRSPVPQPCLPCRILCILLLLYVCGVARLLPICRCRGAVDLVVAPDTVGAGVVEVASPDDAALNPS